MVAIDFSSEPLAVLGGRPRFDRNLHVGTPNIGDRAALMARLEDVLDRRWLTNNGAYVQAFEKRIEEITGARHCVAVANATLGLQLVIRALGLTGEVILPSFTFIATAHALQWLGITPVFCDIDPVTQMLDPDQIVTLITPQTSAVLGVHLWGRPCAPDALARICRRYGLKLLFDAAHAFGCSFGETMIGHFGSAEVFSFHATKCVNSLEGGAIVSNDDALTDKLRLMINFGFSGLDEVSCLGVNGKMNEFCAAMGLTSLDSMAAIIERNQRNYRLYRHWLDGLPGISVLEYATANRPNYHYVVLEVDAERLGLTRDEMVASLWAENVHARRYFYPGCHAMEPYRTLQPNAARKLPATVELCERVMLLPSGTSMGEDDVLACCQLVARIARQRREVRTALECRNRPAKFAEPVLEKMIVGH